MKFVEDRGGKVVWHNRDIRKQKCFVSNSDAALTGPLLSAHEHFENCMESIQSVSSPSNTSVFISISMNSVASAYCPGVRNASAVGLTSEEILSICFCAGKDPNCSVIDICEFVPEVEEILTARLISEMIYYFLSGYYYRLSQKESRKSGRF